MPSASDRIRGNPLGAKDVDEVDYHLGLVFFFFCLALGTGMKHFLSRKLPSVPYTCALLIAGLLLGFLHQATATDSTDENDKPGTKVHQLGVLSTSINMWLKIEPKVMMFGFLPALLFGDAMGFKWYLIKKSLTQCTVLAVLGVAFGTIVTGVVVKYTFWTYEWSWEESFMFGSILAATDPVAVVAILKDLGASVRLTMLISGESLMNDGTAIVLYMLFVALALGMKEDMEELGVEKLEDINGWVIIRFFVWKFIGSVFVGVFMGLCCMKFVHLAGRKTSHTDIMLQIVYTIVFAYFSYFFGEQTLQVSGVLTTVTTGITVAVLGWPAFNSPNIVRNVWHVIEHIGNTIIFLLAGVLIGAKMVHRYGELNLFEEDGILLLRLYLLTNIIRLVMVILFYPVLKRSGYGLTWRDAIVISWSGLRGAVGLALAIQVDVRCSILYEPPADIEAPEERIERQALFGTRVLFHISGIAVLTLLINGSFASLVLRLLGMTSADSTKQALLHDIQRKISEHCGKVFEELVTTEALDDEQQRAIQSKCSILRTPTQRNVNRTYSLDDPSFEHLSKNRAISSVREIFLRTLKEQYWDQVGQGMLPRNGTSIGILESSVFVALDMLELPLCDFDAVRAQFVVEDFLIEIGRFLPSWLKWEEIVNNAGLVLNARQICCILTSFIQGHQEAQNQFGTLLDDGDTPSISEAASRNYELVMQESSAEVRSAHASLDSLDPHLVQYVAVEQVSCIILENQRHFIQMLLEGGVLREQQAHGLLHEVERDIEVARMDARPEADIQMTDITTRQVARSGFLRKNSSFAATSFAATSGMGSDVTAPNVKHLTPNPHG